MLLLAPRSLLHTLCGVRFELAHRLGRPRPRLSRLAERELLLLKRGLRLGLRLPCHLLRSCERALGRLQLCSRLRPRLLGSCLRGSRGGGSRLSLGLRLRLGGKRDVELGLSASDRLLALVLARVQRRARLGPRLARRLQLLAHRRQLALELCTPRRRLLRLRPRHSERRLRIFARVPRRFLGISSQPRGARGGGSLRICLLGSLRRRDPRRLRRLPRPLSGLPRLLRCPPRVLGLLPRGALRGRLHPRALRIFGCRVCHGLCGPHLRLRRRRTCRSRLQLAPRLRQLSSHLLLLGAPIAVGLGKPRLRSLEPRRHLSLSRLERRHRQRGRRRLLLYPPPAFVSFVRTRPRAPHTRVRLTPRLVRLRLRRLRLGLRLRFRTERRRTRCLRFGRGPVRRLLVCPRRLRLGLCLGLRDQRRGELSLSASDRLLALVLARVQRRARLSLRLARLGLRLARRLQLLAHRRQLALESLRMRGRRTSGGGRLRLRRLGIGRRHERSLLGALGGGCPDPRRSGSSGRLLLTCGAFLGCSARHRCLLHSCRRRRARGIGIGPRGALGAPRALQRAPRLLELARHPRLHRPPFPLSLLLRRRLRPRVRCRPLRGLPRRLVQCRLALRRGLRRRPQRLARLAHTLRQQRLLSLHLRPQLPNLRSTFRLILEQCARLLLKRRRRVRGRALRDLSLPPGRSRLLPCRLRLASRGLHRTLRALRRLCRHHLGRLGRRLHAGLGLPRRRLRRLSLLHRHPPRLLRARNGYLRLRLRGDRRVALGPRLGGLRLRRLRLGLSFCRRGLALFPQPNLCAQCFAGGVCALIGLLQKFVERPLLGLMLRLCRRQGRRAALGGPLELTSQLLGERTRRRLRRLSRPRRHLRRRARRLLLGRLRRGPRRGGLVRLRLLRCQRQLTAQGGELCLLFLLQFLSHPLQPLVPKRARLGERFRPRGLRLLFLRNERRPHRRLVLRRKPIALGDQARECLLVLRRDRHHPARRSVGLLLCRPQGRLRIGLDLLHLSLRRLERLAQLSRLLALAARRALVLGRGLESALQLRTHRRKVITNSTRITRSGGGGGSGGGRRVGRQVAQGAAPPSRRVGTALACRRVRIKARLLGAREGGAAPLHLLGQLEDLLLQRPHPRLELIGAAALRGERDREARRRQAGGVGVAQVGGRGGVGRAGTYSMTMSAVHSFATFRRRGRLRAPRGALPALVLLPADQNLVLQLVDLGLEQPLLQRANLLLQPHLLRALLRVLAHALRKRRLGGDRLLRFDLQRLVVHGRRLLRSERVERHQPLLLPLGLAQLLAQLRELRLVLGQQRGARRIVSCLQVDDGVILDRLGARGKVQGGERVFGDEANGRDASNHRGAAVAAQRVLQDARQLRVAVRDVHRAAARVDQRVYHLGQRRERQIDLLALLEPLATLAQHRRALAPSKVDQVQSRQLQRRRRSPAATPPSFAAYPLPCGRLSRLPSRLARLNALLDHHGEHGVRARGDIVEASGRGVPRALPLGGQCPHLLRRAHSHLRQPLDEDAAVRVLSQRHPASGVVPCTLACEKIGECLAVELEEGDAQEEARAATHRACASALDAREELLRRARDHARVGAGSPRRDRGGPLAFGRVRAVAGERLARARGSVAEGRRVEPLQARRHRWLDGARKDLRLHRGGTEDAIKCEGVPILHGDAATTERLVASTTVWRNDAHRLHAVRRRWRYLQHIVIGWLLWQCRPHAKEDPKGVGLGRVFFARARGTCRRD